MNTNERKINLNTILPYGENLRPLITSSNSLSDYDLKNFLAQKGIYISSHERESTIPLIVTSLLSPEEFEILRNKNKTKESQFKRRNRELNWESTNNLLTAFRNYRLPIEEIFPKNKIIPYQLVNQEAFRPVDGNPNHLIANFEIEKIDRTLDWSSQYSNHKAFIELELSADLKKLKVAMSHTADETHSFNEECLKKIKNYLHSNEYISSSKEQKITFGDFTNKTRIKFLLNLLDNNLDNSDTFNFLQLTNVEITIDEKSILPEKIKWMESKVSNIKFSGKSLHETELLINPEFYDSLILSSVKATYEFHSIASKGKCTFDFGFFARGNNIPDNTEFVYKISSLTFDSDNKTKNKIQGFLYAKFDQFKSNAYIKAIENSL